MNALPTQLGRLAKEMTSITETARLAPELASLRALPGGDGHVVVVVPGLLASNASTLLLRLFLSDKAYVVHGWNQGRNMGTVEQFDAFIAEIDALHRSTSAPISLVGWSLGGIASRWVAHNNPTAIRQVITLGSPFRRDPRTSPIWPLYQLASGVRSEDFTPQRLAAVAATPAVPTTSIVSVDDLISPIADGFQPASATSETIQINGSHTALANNATAWRIIADRLGQPSGNWHPFDTDLLTR